MLAKILSHINCRSAFSRFEHVRQTINPHKLTRFPSPIPKGNKTTLPLEITLIFNSDVFGPSLPTKSLWIHFKDF